MNYYLIDNRVTTGVMRTPVIMGKGGYDSHSHDGASAHETMPIHIDEAPQIKLNNCHDNNNYDH